jgi:flagellin
MKIQTNTAANYALGYTRINSQATERSIQKLSSGFRINRAADDAAGLAIANKLRADGKSMSQAQKNAAQGTAMLQTMDGATQTVSTILDRMKELATQSNSDNVGGQRQKLQDEFSALTSEIQRIVDTTKYQGKALISGGFGNTVNTATSTALESASGAYDVKLNGTQAGTYTLSAPGTAAGAGKLTMTDANGVSQTINVAAGGKQDVSFDKFGITLNLSANFTTATSSTAGSLDTETVVVTQGTEGGSFMVSSSGAYSGNDRISVGAVDLNAQTTAGLNINGTITTRDGAAAMLTTLDGAIDKVNEALGKIGAAQSRMDIAASNVATQLQNTLAAESTIRDADMAYEMTQFSKNNILQQAAQSMLSQANQGSQGILQLLRG